MPTYEYACKSCSHQFEIVQSFSDDSLTTCPECGGPLRKIFGNVGITFKGSGFYKTDSRNGSGSGSAGKSGGGSSSESSSTDTKSDSGSSASTSSAGSDHGHSHSHGAHSHTH